MKARELQPGKTCIGKTAPLPAARIAEIEAMGDDRNTICFGMPSYRPSEYRAAIRDLLAEREAREREARAWWPIETAPKDGSDILVAHFAPGAVLPVYAITASWETVMPSTVQCASKTWWHVAGPPLEEKTGSRRYHATYGFLPHPDGSDFLDHAPTHWMPLPEPPA